ncbi:membrane dipeptidase [Phlyctema vagabunda]|uniref:Dipeptidase n=1 Tax=Phlyctema vagabunda TaxID=108571 RepID=A0ABR4PFK7_9HELO
MSQALSSDQGPLNSDINTHLQAQARKLLAEVPLIDGHNDFPYMVRGWYKNRLDTPDFDIQDMPIGQTDLIRLARGMIGGQFWSAFVPCPTKTDDFSTTTVLDPLLATLQQIDLIHSFISLYPDTFGLATSAAEIWEVFRSRRIASLIGVEGLHQIGNSVSVLRMFYRLGVRYVTLTHDGNNMWAESATAATTPHGGLSEKGKSLVKEMNRMGMIIDLSHTNHETQIQTLNISIAPVIFSHSSCFQLTPHVRNVKDETLILLRQNRGIIMICFLPSLTKMPTSPAAVSSVVSHIIHAGELIGYSHVGIGSDFDGMLTGPEGLDDVSCYPALVVELLKRGVSEEDVRLVMGENIIRVLEEAEKCRDRIQKTGREQVMCDIIGEVWTEEQKTMLIEQRDRNYKRGGGK